MTTNPFHTTLDDLFRGQRVRVVAPDESYEGWCRIWHYNEYRIVLEDATRADGTEVGAVAIADPQHVERLAADRTIAELELDAIDPSQYNCREYDVVALEEYAREMRQRERIPASNPVVREVDDEYELVSGHRRTAAARRVPFRSITVRIVDLDDWAATRWFVAEHVPLPYEREEIEGDEEEKGDQAPAASEEPTADRRSGGDPDRWYTDTEIETLVDRLKSDWSTEQLAELPQLQPWI